MEKRVLVRSPVNIAMIKYWGKADQLNIYPMNNSLSLTLDYENIFTESLIKINDKGARENLFFLNNEKKPFNRRMRDVLLYAILLAKKEGNYSKFNSIEVHSKNSFPTGCGIASSASGMSAYALGLCKIFNLDPEKYCSLLARRGSGSACRSTLGGIVLWDADKRDPEQCVRQLFDLDHWPELRVILCIVDNITKKNASTGGMQDSLRTSKFMKKSRKENAEANLKSLVESIEKHDFENFARIIMKESNQLHSICLDTFPPIRYLNESSWTIINFVHRINQHFDRTIVAYTFDAGPNAFLICLESDVDQIIHSLSIVFSKKINHNFQRPVEDFDFLDNNSSSSPGNLQNIFVCKLGSGTLVIN